MREPEREARWTSSVQDTIRLVLLAFVTLSLIGGAFNTWVTTADWRPVSALGLVALILGQALILYSLWARRRGVFPAIVVALTAIGLVLWVTQVGHMPGLEHSWWPRQFVAGAVAYLMATPDRWGWAYALPVLAVNAGLRLGSWHPDPMVPDLNKYAIATIDTAQLAAIGVTLLMMTRAMLRSARDADQALLVGRDNHRAALASRAVQEQAARVDAFVHDEVLHGLRMIAMERDLVPAGAARGSADRLLALLQEPLPLADRSTDLREVLDEVARSQPLKVRVTGGHGLRLPPDVLSALAAATREALRNVVRHAGTTIATVEVVRTGLQVSVTISDRGKGFDVTLPSRRAGVVTSIKRRTEAVGGLVDVVSTPRGTDVVLRWSPASLALLNAARLVPDRLVSDGHAGFISTTIDVVGDAPFDSIAQTGTRTGGLRQATTTAARRWELSRDAMGYLRDLWRTAIPVFAVNLMTTALLAGHFAHPLIVVANSLLCTALGVALFSLGLTVNFGRAVSYFAGLAACLMAIVHVSELPEGTTELDLLWIGIAAGIVPAAIGLFRPRSEAIITSLALTIVLAVGVSRQVPDFTTWFAFTPVITAPILLGAASILVHSSINDWTFQILESEDSLALAAADLQADNAFHTQRAIRLEARSEALDAFLRDVTAAPLTSLQAGPFADVIRGRAMLLEHMVREDLVAGGKSAVGAVVASLREGNWDVTTRYAGALPPEVDAVLTAALKPVPPVLLTAKVTVTAAPHPSGGWRVSLFGEAPINAPPERTQAIRGELSAYFEGQGWTVHIGEDTLHAVRLVKVSSQDLSGSVTEPT